MGKDKKDKKINKQKKTGNKQERKQLKQYYKTACADGAIQVNEIQTACRMCGVEVDLPTAQQLIVTVAGPDRRITAKEFVSGIAQFCEQRKQQMMSILPPLAMQQLHNYYRQACADGMIQLNEIQQACQICGVPCDPATAQQLIIQIAGPDRRITELEFVTGIARFCSMRMQPQGMHGIQFGAPGAHGMPQRPAGPPSTHPGAPTGFPLPGQPQPGMSHPGMSQPGMPQPGMPQPGMSPGMPQPGMMQMGQPGMPQPGMMMMGQPGMMQPGMMQPGMMQMQPGMHMGQPGMMQPGMMPMTPQSQQPKKK